MKLTSISSILVAGVLALSACETTTVPKTSTDREIAGPAQVLGPTKSSAKLQDLPPPARKVDIGVYALPDVTGQFKPVSGNVANNSRAVTQGGQQILTDVLKSAGGGSWFSVVERGSVQNLLRERQIIDSTREIFEGTQGSSLPALKFAGVILEGGIVAYETNEITGGDGARLLGIGSNRKYNVDRVTVTLRMVGVSNGEVLLSTTTTKNIYSFAQQSGAFLYVAEDAIFETEFGTTQNDLPQFAVREAMELGVYTLILDGAQKNLWSFKDPSLQRALLRKFNKTSNSGSRIKPAQTSLWQLGFYNGKVDGVYGSKTTAAVRDFQTSRGVEATGLIDDNLIKLLDEATKEQIEAIQKARAAAAKAGTLPPESRAFQAPPIVQAGSPIKPITVRATRYVPEKDYAISVSPLDQSIEDAATQEGFGENSVVSAEPVDPNSLDSFGVAPQAAIGAPPTVKPEEEVIADMPVAPVEAEAEPALAPAASPEKNGKDPVLLATDGQEFQV